MFGGDGWAMTSDTAAWMRASGANVNILFFDTEIYSTQADRRPGTLPAPVAGLQQARQEKKICMMAHELR